jgi:hypothetical protein
VRTRSILLDVRDMLWVMDDEDDMKPLLAEMGIQSADRSRTRLIRLQVVSHPPPF